MEGQKVGRTDDEDVGKGLLIKGLHEVCYGVWTLY